MSTRSMIHGLLTLTMAAAAGTGCAGSPARLADPHAGNQAMPVRIDGLSFISLNSPRATVISVMRQHGYICFTEAATDRHVPCTRRMDRANSEVVLTFLGDLLDAVRAPIKITDPNVAGQFSRLYDEGRNRYTISYVSRGDQIAIARFLPGDGSTLELRHFVTASALVSVHFAPPRAMAEPLPGNKTALR